MLAAGPTFKYQYDGGLYFNKFDEGSTFHCPLVFVPEQKVFVTMTTLPITVTIMKIPGTNDNIYKVMYDNNKGLHQHLEDDLSDVDTSTSQPLHNPPSTAFPKWITNAAKATLYLNNMSSPNHRTLVKSKSQ